MSWTTPKTWTAGALTAAEMNEQVSANLTWLKAALAYLGVTSDSSYGQLKGAAYGCRLYRGTDQDIDDSSSTAIRWTSEIFDSDALHNASTNTERVTIPTGGDGVYLVLAESEWEANASGDRRHYVTVNGASTIIQGTQSRVRASSAGITAMSSGDLWVASAGDYCIMYAFHNAGSTIAVTTGTLSVVRLFAS